MKIKETEVNPNDFPIYIFHLGKNYRAQEFFGAHEVGKEEFVFRVWAPHASSVRVVGDFNGWDENASIMTKLNEAGCWEAICENVKNYDAYKFLIVDLPGTYSLTAYSPEELYVRQNLIDDVPDVVVNVVKKFP